MDAVSFGPTIKDAHSPDEKILIETVSLLLLRHQSSTSTLVLSRLTASAALGLIEATSNMVFISFAAGAPFL
jgi:hypothetical protein